MIVEARYARGTGVLVGAGGLWLLMTDPGDEQVLQKMWDAVSVPPTPAAWWGASWRPTASSCVRSGSPTSRRASRSGSRTPRRRRGS